MPTARKLLAGLALAMMAVSCSDDNSPTNATAPDQQAPTAPMSPKVAKRALIFPASETVTAVDGVTQYTLQTVQVTHFARNPDATSPYKLLVSGELTFTDAANVVHKEQFTDAPANLTGSGSPTAATCDILTLDLGPLHLDLLGLVVDLAPVHLSITAQSGPGNLLGNLLCAVANLLNGPTLGGLLTTLQNLLNQINAILAGL